MSGSIKIDFDDGSFLLLETNDDIQKINIVMCGRKNSNSVVMSSSNIDKNEARDVVNFINNWLNK